MRKPPKTLKCKHCNRLEPDVKLIKSNGAKIQCCEECYNSPNACEKVKRMKMCHELSKQRRYQRSVLYKREYRKKHWDRALLKTAKQRAKRYNLPIDITADDIIIPKYCPVFGIELKQAENRMNDSSPTLDRLNPKLGYVKGNICVMSNKANRLKSNGTIEDHEKLLTFMKLKLVDKK